MGCLTRLIVAFAAIVLAMVVLGVVSALALARLLPGLVESRVELRTGFPAEISDVSIDATTGRLELGRLVLRNPPDYAHADFVELQNVVVDLSMGALTSRTFVMDRLEADLVHLRYVERADGSSNVRAFLQRMRGVDPERREPPVDLQPLTPDAPATEQEPSAAPEVLLLTPEGSTPAPPSRYRIDFLRVRLGTVALDRFEAQTAALPVIVDVNVELRAQNVTDLPAALEPLREQLMEKGAEELGRELQDLRWLEPGEGRRMLSEIVDWARGLFENVFEKSSN